MLVLAAACADELRPAPPPYRLLVVGWDGASFTRIDPLLEAKKLPHLAALIERGTRAPLASTIVPISSAAWTTASTGKGPGETGVFGFFEPIAESYEQRLVSARSNRAAPLWRILTGRGLGSIVLGVPLTYPPEPILGVMIAGMLAPEDADFAWPQGLADRLRARGYVPDLEPWHAERETSDAELERQLDLRRAIACELLARDDWSLAWIVFKELDVVSHLAYEVDFAARVDPVYEELDRILGALVEAAGADANVIVLSDHGFTTYARGLNLHEWLIEAGFAVRRTDAAPAPLPEGPFATRFAAEASQRLAELDLAKTRAFAFTCEGNFGSVRLNLAGREPAGIVEPGAVEAELAELEQRLRAHPAVVDVWRASELLPGPHRAALPDLLFETTSDVQVFAERGAPLEGEYPHPLPDHDRTGILVAAGPFFARGARVQEVLTLLDVAPSALHLLEQPIPREMRGRVAHELLNGTGEPRFVAEAELELLAPSASGEPYTEAELAELERRLRALGYGD